jgi:dienelactone hydrolase
MAQSCCLAGFEWDGTPTGTEGKLGDLNAYIAGNTGSHACILVIHDLFGWTFNNLRLLCDHYAKEAECAVYMPDL